MNDALIELQERGAFFSYQGEAFRTWQDIPHEDIYGVNFSGTDVFDDDVQAILVLHNVTMISFWRTAISDRSISLLPSLPNLVELNLCGTQITDASIPALATMSSLTHLDVAETQMTPEGIADLLDTLPNAYIRN